MIMERTLPSRRNFLVALAGLAILAGCSTASMDLVNRGKRYEFSAAGEPEGLARCIAANALRPSGSYTTAVSQLTRPNSFEAVVSEVMVRPVNLDYRAVIIVARTSPSETGSRLELYLSESLNGAAAEDWIARLRQGCWT